TFNGLSRYDGTTFKNYYHDPADPTSLCWNSTGGFAEDDAGHLWIATGKGLAMFDYATETFSCYSNDPGDSTSISGNLVQGVFQDSEKHLWVFTHSAGMNLFDKKTGTFKPFLLRPEISIPHYNWVYNTVNSIAEDIENPDILWLAGHRNGLHKFNKSTQKLTRLNAGIFEEHIVYMDKPGELWIGTWGKGLIKLNTKTLEWQQLSNPSKLQKDLPADSLIVTDIKSRGGKLLYLATNSYGVVVYNRETKEFSTLIPNVREVLSMDERAVVKILFDDQDRLWAFSYSGVFLFDPNTVFIKSQKIPLKNLSMSSIGHIVSDIDVDIDGNYWISTAFGNGVYKMSPDRKKIVPVEIALGKNSLLDNRYQVRNILVDKKGNVWIIDGNTRLLAKYNPTTDRFEAFKPEKYRKLFKKDFYPNNLQEDSEGNLWMAASFAGLIKYEFDRDTFKHFVSWEEDEQMLDSRVAINKIYFDSKDNIWISTGAYGIYVFDTRTEKFSHRFFPKYGNVKYERKFLGIVEAPDGKIWTSRQHLGIRVIDPAMPDNQKGGLITHKDGLPATVFGMEKDTSGSLWMATRRGLVKYDFDKKKFRVFGKQEGFSDLFDWNLPFKVIRTGEVFWGKKDGTFYLFHPDSLPFNRKPPPLVFTKFEVLGKEKHFAKSLDYLEKVTLPYAENFFTLNFAALNFTNPEDNQYRYILEGYDKEWINSGNRNFAAYTNVREGSYLFRVRAANNDGAWNEEGISLKIKILPPWYRSRWAYGLYALLLAGAVFVAYRFQRHRWELRSQLALEQAEATRLKELDETKSRLYTNITHEFRTPLTVILGLAEQLKLKPKIKWENRLDAIRRNGSQLLELINQMLDLNKLQSGTMKPEYVQGNIVAYLNYLTASYQSFAFSQNKSLAFFADPDGFQMDYDPEKMQRILGNLLSNAIKFTPEYGSIKVEAR
ncbi:MAG TPA: sensor histidine kinase, partial [Bacteroidetes bacterium]|nr:sensor histidine kinase [Bacteroidota bacterium]